MFTGFSKVLQSIPGERSGERNENDAPRPVPNGERNQADTGEESDVSTKGETCAEKKIE